MKKIKNSGQFKKGQVAWNKGLTKETSLVVKKYSDAKLGRPRLDMIGNKFCTGKTSNKKGKTHIELYGKERAEKMRLSNSKKHIGKKIWNKGLTKITSEKVMRVAMLKVGIPRSEETKRKIRYKRAFQIFPLEDSSIEKKMQNELNLRSINFIKHKPIVDIEHAYNCDIFIEPNIVVECDGDYWHSILEVKNRDKFRNKEMLKKGYFILRFQENEINANIEGCVDEIENYLCMTNNKKVYEGVKIGV